MKLRIVPAWRAPGIIASVACFIGCLAGCNRGGESLGLPDSYLLFAPLRDDQGQARTGPSGLPLCGSVSVDDARAAQLGKLFMVGFAGEVLRTDYLVKQFIRDASWQGKQFPAAARRRAAEPTVFLADKSPAPAGVGLALKGSWGGASDHRDLAWVGIADSKVQDATFVQTISGTLGRRIATAIAGGASEIADGAPAAAPPVALIDGYAQALEVIAREWRVGEGPNGAVAPDAGTTEQRELFAAVRQNRFARGPDGHSVRRAEEMLGDPGLVATVLYRFAQAKGVGHRVGPPDLYTPFVAQRVPEGVSPAAVLGPFRNFQAKLIAVWGRAVLRGRPPRDIVDLVEAYAAELPAERAEAFRLFVVTTWGATIKPGGVSPTGGGGGGASAGSSGGSGALPELTALAAEVSAGRRSLRQALTGAAKQ